ncbi:PREDICTED: ras association domain-containing protein 2 isoform X4 [Thamnophis sirtalis]|uniref:Ras association domain-containing protein 2 isoform X4 n=1 Tax=Thamnophis sirtalis TaxID=35019 RepID=A0A6I9Z3A6_9SAUR|nr:PREDICTED: ras association domain-containing protein 2 isoform X4 [Thamnophis sirtalis]
MEFDSETTLVPCGQDKFISKNELLLHLKTYNLYYEGQNLQLRHREEEGEFIVEGSLNISWGLCRPIRLQMQDDNQRLRPPPSSSSWHSGCNLGTHGSVLKPTTLPDIQVTEAEPTSEGDPTEEKAEDNEFKDQLEETPQLMRTRSDVGVRRRGNLRTPSDQRRIKRHRFSINGHFYNHKTSVFTPAYGSVTNVRINSTMTTPQVLKLLLNKFKVAQYIKFEMPVLKSFIQKLEEEEDREVKKLKHNLKNFSWIDQELCDVLEISKTYSSCSPSLRDGLGPIGPPSGKSISCSLGASRPHIRIVVMGPPASILIFS